GAAAEARVDAELFHRLRCGPRKPLLELAIEVTTGIALAACKDTSPAGRRQLLVDEARYRRIGRSPVAVAAAEHRIAHLGERILRHVAAEPFDELRGVIGWR